MMNLLRRMTEKLFAGENLLDKRRRLQRRYQPQVETLEDRVLPTVGLSFVNDNWHLRTDSDSSGTLTAGDIVDNRNDGGGTGNLVATYGNGFNAFGTVTSGVA